MINIFIVFVIATVVVALFYLMSLSNEKESVTQDEQELLYTQGEVILTIPENGFGKVLLNMDNDSNRLVARSSMLNEIQTGTVVVVIAIEANEVLVVEPI